MIQEEMMQTEMKQTAEVTFVHDWEREIGKALPHPWIRLCARLLDGAFYWILILVYQWIVEDIYFPGGGMGGNLTFWRIVGCRYLILILMMVLEPIQLTLFGTTLGKAVFGLSVKGRNGRNLPLESSVRRTFGVILHGFGLGIPYLMEWQCIKNYRMVRKEEPADWEKLRRYQIKDRKPIRIMAFVLGMLLLAGIDLGVMTVKGRPVHRGQVTPEQFAEDCTRLAYWYGFDQTYQMHGDGKWRNEEGAISYVHMATHGRWERAEGMMAYEFQLEDGYVTGVDLVYRNKGRDWVDHMTEQKAVALLTMIGQREDVSWLEWIYACKMVEWQLLRETDTGARQNSGAFEMELLHTKASQQLVTDGYEYDDYTHFYHYVITPGRRLYEMVFEVEYVE